MLTFRGLIGAVLIWVLLAIFLKVNAVDQQIKVLVKPPASPDLVVDAVFIYDIFDNQNKTSTIKLMACGSEIVVTYPNSKATSKELENAVMGTIEKACKQFLN